MVSSISQKEKMVPIAAFGELASIYQKFAHRMDLYVKITEALNAPELPGDDLHQQIQTNIKIARIGYKTQLYSGNPIPPGNYK
jgi:hypothetical protein